MLGKPLCFTRTALPHLCRDCSPHLCRNALAPSRICTGDWARHCHICTGTGLAAATSAPGTGLTAATSAPGTGLAAATSAPGLGSPPARPRDGFQEPAQSSTLVDSYRVPRAPEAYPAGACLQPPMRIELDEMVAEPPAALGAGATRAARFYNGQQAAAAHMRTRARPLAAIGGVRCDRRRCRCR